MTIIPHCDFHAWSCTMLQRGDTNKTGNLFSCWRKRAIPSCHIPWVFSGLVSQHKCQLLRDGFTALFGPLVKGVVFCAPCELLKYRAQASVKHSVWLLLCLRGAAALQYISVSKIRFSWVQGGEPTALSVPWDNWADLWQGGGAHQCGGEE